MENLTPALSHVCCVTIRTQSILLTFFPNKSDLIIYLFIYLLSPLLLIDCISKAGGVEITCLCIRICGHKVM